MLFFIILFLAVGMLALYKGADLLIAHASSLAAKLGVSTVVVGMTVITIGTILPELSVMVASSLRQANDLIIGNALGTTAFNFGIVLGIAALINPIAIQDSVLKHEFPWLMLYAAVIYFLAFDLLISRGDALILLFLAAAFVWYSIRQSRREVLEKLGKLRQHKRQQSAMKTGKSWFKIILGMVLILGGAKLFVDASLSLAQHFAFSEYLAGLLVIAVGTSLPELVTAVMASARHQPALGVGNAIGSATMNVLFVVGIAALIRPIVIHPDMLIFDFPMVLFFTILISVLFGSSHRLSRFEGALLVAGYVVYLAYGIKFWGLAA